MKILIVLALFLVSVLVGGTFHGTVSFPVGSPVNTALPTIASTSPVIGTLETSTNGSWTGSPTSYAYQWMYADTSANISGATASSYTPIAGDYNHTLKLRVTATNANGSTSADSAVSSATAINNYYSTTFALTENPISENGAWRNGGTIGLDWGNVKTASSMAMGVNLPNFYGDPSAALNGSWSSNQQAQATVYVSPSITTGYHEVEIRLRTTISAHSITGYEALCSVDPTNPYVSIVRWNGANGDFTSLVNVSPGPGCANGDILSAKAVGNVITEYKNGVQVAQATDSTFSGGSPGIGLWNAADSIWNTFGLIDFSASVVSADATNGVIPSDRSAYSNWSIAGLKSIGGFPARNQCGSTLTPLGGGSDDTTQVQNAINSCSANGFVKLGAGTFQIKTPPLVITTNITLRGSGPGTTILANANGVQPYPTGGTGNQIVSLGVRFGPWYGDCDSSGPSCQLAYHDPSPNSKVLSLDAAKGATSITVNCGGNCGSFFTVGQVVLLDEASAGAWQSDPAVSGYQVWAPSDFRLTWRKHNPVVADDFTAPQFPFMVQTAGDQNSRLDRPTTELKKISSISGNTITFDSPLTIDYRAGGIATFTGSLSGGTLTASSVTGTLAIMQPLVSPTMPTGSYISAFQSGSGGAGTYSVICPSTCPTITNEAMTAAPHMAEVSWLGTCCSSGSAIDYTSQAGLEDLTVENGGSGNVTLNWCVYCWVNDVESTIWSGLGIQMNSCFRCEIDRFYAHDSAYNVPGGGAYALVIDHATTECLVQDGISMHANKVIVARAAGAGCVIAYNYFDEGFVGNQGGWVEVGLNASHWEGPHHILMEGNWAFNGDEDNTHGSADYITYFRNWLTGIRHSFVDQYTGTTYNDVTLCCGPYRAAGPMSYSYWHSFIGNVLGTSGITTAANNWVYQDNNFRGSGTTNRAIWAPGYGMVNTSGVIFADTQMINNSFPGHILRGGNYDYITQAVHWEDGTMTVTIPNSFFLVSAPSYFSGGASCTYPWPWVTPDAGSPVQTNSCGGSGLPAKARWDAGTPFVQP